MKTQMDRVFEPKKNYAHTIFTPSPDDECFICKEPYDSNGCRPICLTECGHTMGLECFIEFTTRTSKKCPYGGHELRTTYELDEKNLPVTVLVWLCSTRFFRQSLVGGINIREGMSIWDVLRLNLA
jgi:hypothetical protein